MEYMGKQKTKNIKGMFNEVCQELKNIDDTLVLFPA